MSIYFFKYVLFHLFIDCFKFGGVEYNLQVFQIIFMLREFRYRWEHQQKLFMLFLQWIRQLQLTEPLQQCRVRLSKPMLGIS